MIRIILLTFLFALPSSPGQTERGERPTTGVPILRDIPLLETQFSRNQESSIWIPLPKAPHEGEATTTASIPVSGVLSKADQAMLTGIRARFPALKSLELVEKITVKHSGSDSTFDRERGLLAKAQKILEKDLRDAVQDYVRLAKTMLHWEVVVLDVGPASEVSEGQVKAIRRAAFEKRKQELSSRTALNILSAPKVTTLHGQKAMISTLTQTPYVKDFTSQTIENSTILDPVVDVISDGFTIEFLGVLDPVLPDITLESRVHFSSLQRPIGTFTTKLHGHEVTLQIPRVESCVWSTEAFLLSKDWDGFCVTGLRSRTFEEGRTNEPRSVEVWCFVSIVDPHLDQIEEFSQRGVVERIDGNTVIVAWLPGLFASDPWQSAPEIIGFSRDSKPMGQGLRTGGYVTGDPTDGKKTSFSVYRLTSGTAAVGDVAY